MGKTMQEKTLGFSRTRGWRQKALATTALVTATLAAQAAFAEGTWTGAVSSDYDTAGNWAENAVPNETALSFGAVSGSNVVNMSRPIGISTYAVYDSFTFEAGADSYLIEVRNGAYVSIGVPVVNDSGVTQNFTISGSTDQARSILELHDDAGDDVVYTAGANSEIRVGPAGSQAFAGAGLVLDGGRFNYYGTGVLELGSVSGSGDIAYVLNGAETGTLRVGGLGTAETVEVLAAKIEQIGHIALEKVGAGTLILTGENGYTGGTSIFGGTLQFGQGALSSPLVGNVNTGVTGASGTLAFGYDGDTNYSSVISGVGNLDVLDGRVTLSGMNTFTGATTISEGATLALSGQGRVNQSSGVEVNGTFDLSGHMGTTVKAISGTGVIDVGSASLGLTDSTGIFAGNIKGTGGVNINSGGSLVLTGTNDLTGQFGISEAASLTVGDGATSGSIAANVLNYGTVTFDRSNEVTYAGRITGTGDLVFTGGGTFILTAESSASGEVEIAQGTTLQLGNGGTTGRLGGSPPNSGSIANDGTLIYNRSNAVTYAGPISGEGDLRQIGSGRLTLNGMNSYSGGTTVEAGELLVGGTSSFATATVSGPVSVYDGASLGGFGTIDGDLSIFSGGSLSAGISGAIGTLRVAGDLSFAEGSQFNVKVNAATGASDLLEVGGTATLAGSVAHIGFSGIYDPVSSYTILTAADLSGTFGGVSSDFAFLYPVLSYTGTDVNLSLVRNDLDFTEVTTTPNQFAVAEAVEDLGAGSPIYGAVAPLGATEANAAFDSLSGEAHASTGSFLMGNSGLLRDALGQRMRSSGATSGNGSTVSSKGAVASVTTPVWASSFGSWSDFDGSSNAEGLSGSSGGLVAGVDHQFDSGWLVGAAFGVGRSGFDLDDGSASVDSNDWHLGLYGDRSWGNLTLRTGLGFTSHNVSSERDVMVGPISETQGADYNARTVQTFGELGYRIDRAGSSLEPFLNLAYARYSSDNISEDGGVTALDASQESQSTTFATLGVRGTHDFALAATPARLEGAVAWRHASGDLRGSSVNSFMGGGGFTVSGIELPEDMVTLEAGLGLSLAEGSDFSIGYAGQFGDGTRQDGLRATLKIRF